MKEVYYYSKTAAKVQSQPTGEGLKQSFVYGKRYTNCQSFEDDAIIPATDNWDDSVIVFVKENLPIDETFFEQ